MMYTANALKKLLSSIDQGEFKYQKKEKQRIDWTAYDCAQIHEISDMLKIIRDTVDYVCIELDIDSKPKSKGRPPTHPGDVAKALLMQQYFGTANRVAEGLVRLFKEKLGISEFSYKTIERGYDRDDVKTILYRILGWRGTAHFNPLDFPYTSRGMCFSLSLSAFSWR